MNKKEPVFKTLARFIAFRIVHVLSVFLKSRNSGSRDIPVSEIKNVLIVDTGLLGDLLMTTPLIAGVRKCLPEAKITLICTPWSREAVSNNQHINHIHTYEAFWEDRATSSKPKLKHLTSTLKLITFYRRNRYDIVFVVSAREQPFVTFLGYLSGAKYRIGVDHSLGKGFLTHTIKDTGEHLTKLKLALLKVISHGNLPAGDMVYNIKPTSKERAEEIIVQSFGSLNQDFVCVTPSTLQSAKQWDIDLWAELINKLTDEGIGVIIGGGKADIQYTTTIYNKISNRVLCRQMTGEVSLEEFAVFMLRSLCLITVESAPMHLASALKIPCVILFSRVYDFKRFEPLHSGALSLYNDVECAMCSKGCRMPRCMSFTVNAVYESMKKAVNRPAR